MKLLPHCLPRQWRKPRQPSTNAKTKSTLRPKKGWNWQRTRRRQGQQFALMCLKNDFNFTNWFLFLNPGRFVTTWGRYWTNKGRNSSRWGTLPGGQGSLAQISGTTTNDALQLLMSLSNSMVAERVYIKSRGKVTEELGLTRNQPEMSSLWTGEPWK